MRVSLLLAVVMLSCGKPPCSAATCATGCCDAAEVCQLGTQTLACGIGGARCDVCTLGEQCLQGTCFGGSTGGGTGTGGGGGGLGIRLIPATATVGLNSSVELSGQLTGSAPDQRINWSVESGGGYVSASGPSSATYYAYSALANVRIRAQANFMSSLAAFADFTISRSVQDFLVVPQAFSTSPYALSPGSTQTFGAVRSTSPSSVYVGVRGIDWTMWPSGAITEGTLTASPGMTRVYARERATNVWSSTDIRVENTSEPSVSITPALSTVAPNGVVQLTANVSTGAAVSWVVASLNGGTISSSGTYTAPGTPGVYAVAAQTAGTPSTRLGVATIIVQ